MDCVTPVGSSFRDPAARVVKHGALYVRNLTAAYADDWRAADQSGLLDALVSGGLFLPFREREALPGAWKTIVPEQLTTISYPYEWSFGQLKDAAILTLRILREAVARGMTLKDASAYNVQFQGARPVFIDTASLERRLDEGPWQAYRQFCMHFLAPLALSSVDLRYGALSRLWIDGIPLDMATRMLPMKTRFSPGLFLHLFLHARAISKYGDARKSAGAVKKARVDDAGLLYIADSLQKTVEKLKAPVAATEWGDYYTDTNYSPEASAAKKSLVERAAREGIRCESGANPGRAVDLGANTGEYSSVLAGHFGSVIAADLDPLAVHRHYLKLRESGNSVITPLVLDLGNPSPALGWNCEERQDFASRARSEMAVALALIHHLRFTAGIPFERQAAFFSRLLVPGGRLVVEYIPKDDSQIQRMLAARDDVFDDYTPEAFMTAFGEHFRQAGEWPIPDSGRSLYILEKVSS